MLVLPTAYWAPTSYFLSILDAERRGDRVYWEGMETFEKQTFRNRCFITSSRGERIGLSIPLQKVEHKQLTRDIKICYQQNWQHRHWMAMLSEYKHKPYFLYYEDYLRPLYQQPFTFLMDYNYRLTDIVLHLLRNDPPTIRVGEVPCTNDWQGDIWTDTHPWQKESSVMPLLFEYGPALLLQNER